MPVRLPEPYTLEYPSTNYMRLPPCEPNAIVVAAQILPNGGCLYLIQLQGNFFYFFRRVEARRAVEGKNAQLSFNARRYKTDSGSAEAIIFSPFNESEFIVVFNDREAAFGRAQMGADVIYMLAADIWMDLKDVKQIEWLSSEKLMVRNIDNRVEIFCLNTKRYERIVGQDIRYINAITTPQGNREVFAIRNDGVLMKFVDINFIVWTIEDLSQKALLAVAPHGACAIANNAHGEMVRFDFTGQKPPIIFGRDKEELLFLAITEDGQHMAYVKASNPKQFIVSSATTEGPFYKYVSAESGSPIVDLRVTDRRRVTIAYANSALGIFDFYE